MKASKEGFVFQSADGDFNLRIRGYAQADGRFYLDSHNLGTSTFLLRRARPPEDERSGSFEFGDHELLPDEGLLRRKDGTEVHCTRTEFRLLCVMAASPNKVLSRETLLEKVWGYDYFGDSRLVDVHIILVAALVVERLVAQRRLQVVGGFGGTW